METLNYQEIVKDIISKYAKDQAEEDLENTEIVFDTERDIYLLLYTGWKDENRIYGCPIHISIKDGKIWIQHNGTERRIAQDLLELGVPKQDIVLAFHSPTRRKDSDFAVN